MAFNTYFLAFSSQTIPSYDSTNGQHNHFIDFWLIKQRDHGECMAPNLGTWSWIRMVEISWYEMQPGVSDWLYVRNVGFTHKPMSFCHATAAAQQQPNYASLLWPCAYQRRYRVVRVQHETGVMSSCNIITNWSRSAYCLLLLLTAVATAFLQSVNKKISQQLSCRRISCQYVIIWVDS